MPVQLSVFETTRRKSDETYDNRTCYNFRTLQHVRARANHWCSRDWDEWHNNRLASEPHGECDWHDGLFRPEQGGRNASENTLMPNRSPSGSTLTPTGLGSGSVGKKESPARSGTFSTRRFPKRNGLSGIAMGPQVYTACERTKS
jgi:hypothetical protein